MIGKLPLDPRFVICLLLACLLCACTSPRPSPTVAEPTRTSTDSPAPANTITPSRTPTVTPALSPSNTSTPTLQHTPTIHPTQTKKPTQTLAPSRTPTPIATATINPFHLPTFDPASAVTRIPSPPAQCPAVDPNLKADPDAWIKEGGFVMLQDEPILEFLNAGGSPEAVLNALSQKYARIFDSKNYAARQDLTGDGLHELVLTDQRIVYILGCKDGKYQTLFHDLQDPDWEADISYLLPGDMNLDGIPEIITVINGGHGYPTSQVTIYEWNGTEFASLTQDFPLYGSGCCDPFINRYFLPHVSVQDVDGNGTLELLLTGLPGTGSALYSEGVPWRKETDTYTWNGAIFILSHVAFTPPEYRFQAVQDGHRAALSGDNDTALDLYQQVIFSDQLKPWSLELFRYFLNCSGRMEECKPYPTPTPEPNEYSNLAAYARYRIILLHLLRGYLPKAEVVYRTLQEIFPTGQPGHAYAEMATAFWEAYQSTQSMGQSCAKAVEYASAHPEDILSYLGNSKFNYYFGTQSLKYTPQDVCPYR